jgi:branched-chain amino acid aminotransferase
MHKPQAICWINGSIKPAEQAHISVFDHGFLYGDGIFEGIRFYAGKPFLLHAHLQRLFDSAQAIALHMPLSEAQLTQAITDVIAATGLQEGYIRLIITRGAGCLGINPKHCKKPNVVMIADTLNMIDEAKRHAGARLITASTRKLMPDSFDARIKSLNYLNQIMAKIEANHAGADEAIMLNHLGYIAEGTADNVFIEKQGKLITPPATDGGLAGITRAAIIKLARQQDIAVYEQSITPYDIYTADACFLTGTGAELIPVASLDGRKLASCPSTMFLSLTQAFKRLIQEECA